jgi:hypothetical protein
MTTTASNNTGTSGQLCCLVYISTAYQLLTEAELEQILTDARQFNAQVEVTGVLLHHEGTFFQYIEGECGEGKGLEQVFHRVQASRRHFSIIKLMQIPIEQRLFSDWLMGSTHVSADTMLSLKSASWELLNQELKQRPEDELHPALQLLKSQWQLSTSPEKMMINNDYNTLRKKLFP